MLPKEKHSDLNGESIKPVIYQGEVVGYADKDYEKGYNQCLQDIKAKLHSEGLFKK